MRRVTVLGGGPAGLLAAHGLHRAGWSVTVLDRGGPRPQAEHTHRLPAALWRSLLEEIPGLWEQLQAGGALRAPDGEVWCSRGLLDAALHHSIARLLPARTADVTVARGDRMWRLAARDGRGWSTPALVDATGARRASLSALDAVTLDVGPVTPRTVSAAVSGLEAPMVWRSGQVLLQPEEHGRHRLSLRCPTGAPLPRSAAALRAALPPRLAAQIAAGEIGALRLSGGRPCRRPVLPDDLPAGWALVGDAAVETSPVHGWGVWLAWQCAQRLQAADTLAEARVAITHLSQRSWEEAMLRDALAAC